MLREMDFHVPLVAFCMALAALYWLIPLARRIGYVDSPGGRKHHSEHTPIIGGLVILPVAVLSIWAAGVFDHRMALLFVGVCIIFMMGAYDDVRQIRPWVKFFIQLAVAAFLVLFGGAEVRVLGNLFGLGEVGLNIFSIPFSIAALVLFMNALNLMDGLDGLAGGIAAVLLGWLAFAAWQSGEVADALRLLCILAPLAAFLCLNMRHPFLSQARVFLGDAGSLSLALVAAWFAIDLSREPAFALTPAGVMWLVAIPVMDTLTLFFIRKMRGRHPFSPDRNHLHHRFLDKNVPPHWVTPIILFCASLCGLIGVYGPAFGVPEAILFYGWWSILLLYVGYSLRPGADRQFE